jgi:antitoxin component YwqK of YwqJK toxin-antitoxin module
LQKPDARGLAPEVLLKDGTWHRFMTATSRRMRLGTQDRGGLWKNRNGGSMKAGKTSPSGNGPHQELFADGGLSGEGSLKTGKRHGPWTFYFKSGGKKATGRYLEGELDGHWEWWRENGQRLQAGAFEAGKQVGLWKRFYENGQLWDEGKYADGKKIGEWKVYEKTGELKSSKTWGSTK